MRRLLLTLLVTGLAVPATAQAETYFAAPTGPVGGTCTAAEPCAVETAFGRGTAADTVEVGPGDYPAISGSRTVRARVSGVRNGRARPIVRANGTLTFERAVTSIDVRGSVDGATLATFNGTTPSNGVDVRNAGAGTGCEVAAAELINALCVGGVQGVLVSNGQSLINVTASGGTNNGMVCATGLCRLVNTIASGGTIMGAVDVQARAGTSVTQTTSAYSSTAGTVAATSLADPGFADEAGGNYRPAGATTVDVGSMATGVGGLDLDSNARTIGTAPDIGAYERVQTAPAVAAAPATDVTDTSATLHATITTNGGFTTHTWTPGGGTGSTVGSVATRDATLGLSGLQPGTTYSYSVVATNDAGSSAPVTVTVTTTGTAPGSGGATPPVTTTPPVSQPTTTTPMTPRKLEITGPSRKAARRLVRRGRAATVRVVCPTACGVRVRGELRKGKRRLGALATPKRVLQIGDNGRGTLSVRASKALRRTAARGRITVVLRVTVRSAGAKATTRTLRIRAT